MKHYEKLKQAVADGKFKKFEQARKLGRIFLNNEAKDEARILEAEITAVLDTDGIIDDDKKALIVASSIECLAEKLITDKVFESTKKIESFDDFFGMMKDIVNL